MHFTRQLKITERRKRMSKKIKCMICEAAEDEDCEFMTVKIEENGKETKYCCENLHKEHIKRI